METFIIILKIIVSISLFNVWLIQGKKATRWRGGDAKTIYEEFETYGLPQWLLYLVGFLKVSLSVVLIASIWYPSIEMYPAIGLAALLSGSVIMHLAIKDPLYKSFPAALFLTMCLLIYFL